MNTAAIFHQPSMPWLSIDHEGYIEIKCQTGKDIDRITLIYGDPHSGKFNQNSWIWNGLEIPMECTGEGEQHLYFSVRVKAPQNRLKYCFKIMGEKTVYYADRQIRDTYDPSNIFQFDFLPYVFVSEAYQAPSNSDHTFWYQIFPDRFHASPAVKAWADGPVDNLTHSGGNLKGIEEKLPYLSRLGITGIYLTPIFESPTVHKYDTRDYYSIDTRFGTEDDLIQLVNRAHELGIKVMLDAVFNHTGTDFFAWKEAQKPNSPYRDWYYIHSDSYETFSFAQNMPKLNSENPEVIDYFCKVGQYWVEKANIDGWRLDVANELSVEFIRQFRKRVKSCNKEVLILGEIWHDSNRWLSGDMFDSVMNYPFMRVANQFIIQNSMDEKTFNLAVCDYLNRYPFDVITHQFNLYDSHDTIRLYNQSGFDISRVISALAFLYVSPGSPCIYYGTENAMKGDFDPDNRRCMQFHSESEPHPLQTLIKLMIKLRSSLKPLSTFNQWSAKADKDTIRVQWLDTTIMIPCKAIYSDKAETLSDFGIEIKKQR